MFSTGNNFPWICFGASFLLNAVMVFLYIRLSKQTKDIRTFKVNTLNTIFYKDLTRKENKGNKH